MSYSLQVCPACCGTGLVSHAPGRPHGCHTCGGSGVVKMTSSGSGQNPHACGDGGCILLVASAPVETHTNGGCGCLTERMSFDTRARVRQGILWLKAALEAAETRPITLKLRQPREMEFSSVGDEFGGDDD